MHAKTSTSPPHVLGALTLLLTTLACSGDVTKEDSTSDAVVPGGACSSDGQTAEADDGCNSCTCSGGRWSCTEMACVDASTGTCTDGEKRQVDCNACTCSGGGWSCTEMACVDASTGTCTDGETRQVDCNTCTCSGGDWLCTTMGCLSCPPPVQSSDVCAAVMVYAKDPAAGTCCEYGAPCQAPTGWEQFASMDACNAGTSSHKWFSTCGAPVCGGPGTDGPTGQALCQPDQTEGAPCSDPDALCDPSVGCGVNYLCATEDPRMSPGGCPISRARFKEDIHYVSRDERESLSRAVLDIPIATWRYRESSDRRPHLGFIIEDVEPSPGVDSGRDRVDLYGLTTMAIAALQQQAEQIRSLEAELETLRGADGAICGDR